MLRATIAFPAGEYGQTTHNGETEKAVNGMEQDCSAGVVKGDAATIAPMVAETAYTVTPDGSTSTKAQFLADMKSGDLKFEQNTLSDMKVQVADADMAVVTYLSSDKGMYKGKDISGEYRWTDVLVKSGDKWEFVVSQGTSIASGDK